MLLVSEFNCISYLSNIVVEYKILFKFSNFILIRLKREFFLKILFYSKTHFNFLNFFYYIYVVYEWVTILLQLWICFYFI